MLKVFETEIIESSELSPSTYIVKINGSISYEPGQFVMVSLLEQFSILPRPFSIFYAENGNFSILFKVFGGWTKKLAESPKNTKVRVVGPCGTGFISAMKRYKITHSPSKILFIAGGLGIASLFSSMIHFSKEQKVLIFGGRTQQDIIIRDRIESVPNLDVHITTQDGSLGTKGVVTDVLYNIPLDDFDIALCCGPVPMIKALKEFWDRQAVKVPLLCSMEERMACGIGICFSCVVKTSDKYKLCCKYGPVFLHSELIL